MRERNIGIVLKEGRKFAAIAAAIIFVVMISSCNAVTVLLNEDFSDDTVGSDPDWTIHEDTNTNIQVFSDSGNNRCFLNDDSLSGECDMLKEFSKYSYLNVELDIKISEKDTNVSFSITLRDNGDAEFELGFAKINGDRSVYAISKGEVTSNIISIYTPDTWMHYTIKLYPNVNQYYVTDGTNDLIGTLDSTYDGVNQIVIGTDTFFLNGNWNDNKVNATIDNIVIQYNYAPYEPSNPNPPNGATSVAYPLNLSWEGGDPDGDPVTYDLYFGNTSPPPLYATDLTETEYSLQSYDFQPSTTYYWKIIAKDSGDATTEGDIWQFTTEAKYPVASFTFEIDGKVVTVNASASYDPDGTIVLCEWDWESDGIYDNSSTSPIFRHTYEKEGNYTITLRVTDNDGLTDTTTSAEGGVWIIIKSDNNILRLPFSWFAMFLMISIGILGVALSAFFLKPESIKHLGYAPAAGTMLITILSVGFVLLYESGVAWYWLLLVAALIIFIFFVTIKTVLVNKRKTARRVLGFNRHKRRR